MNRTQLAMSAVVALIATLVAMVLYDPLTFFSNWAPIVQVLT